ncbi:flagellar M-ring protein FliF [Lachnospiraceae bacterium KM106-2]|nr:flagellar M-ring protein FliF [Lachnospiraceae bacterium KM106-2]
MQERLKHIKESVLAFWNKYSKKQKTIVISILAAIVITVVILSIALTRKEYKNLTTCEDTKSASEVMDLMTKEGIDAKLGDDNLTILVDKSKYKDAVLVVGKNDVQTSSGMTYDDVFSGGISTTESDKKRKSTLALQNDVRSKLMTMSGIKDAVVYINQPEDDYTIISEATQANVSVMLTLENNTEITAENAQNIASFLSNMVGNDKTDNVTIIDSKGNLLFGGDSSSTLGGNISSVYEYKQKLTNNIMKNVKELLLKNGSYNDVQIGASNIKFDMNKVSELYTEYTPAEGQEQGLYSKSYTYKAEGAGSSSGTPGTDSNDSDSTSYQIDTSGDTSSKVTQEQYEYLPNEKKTNTEYEVGAVKPDESSMGIVLTEYKVYNEDELKNNGDLDGTTWEKFVSDNNKKTKLKVDDDTLNLIASTTGIATNNLTVTAWQQPIFQASEEKGTNYNTILMIVLAALILGLLGFIVFKGTKPVEVVEEEPELSVEQLLATTKENQSLEDIEFGDKSETRKMVEKFVDDNPEAVAQLLRNWLNEDWG